MGDSILKGISAALLVTVITLLAGLVWTAMEFGGISPSTLVDIGLVASCIAAGYVTGKESGQWILGGVSSLGYVLVCVLLMALFLELRAWGVIQVLAEGGLIGILAGALGAGNGGKKSRPLSWRGPRFSSWGDNYSNRAAYSNYSYSRAHEEWDEHVDEWDHLLDDDRYDDGWEEEPWKMEQKNSDEEEWDNWLREEKNKSTTNYRKAWWEEDVL